MTPRWPNFSRHPDPSTRAKHTPLNAARFVILDTELTSLDDRSNRLLSVGAITMTGTKIHIGEQFYRIVNPGVAVPAESVVIHHLRLEDVAQGEPPATVLGDFSDFISGAVLVGHFAEIDRNVLRKEFAAVNRKLEAPMVCTARVQRWILSRQQYTEDHFHKMEQMDLASLAKLYDLEFREAHHALDDAFVTARLWQKQLHALAKLDVQTLGNLLRFAKV